MFQLSSTLYHNDMASRFDNPEPGGQFRQFSSNAELLLGFLARYLQYMTGLDSAEEAFAACFRLISFKTKLPR